MMAHYFKRQEEMKKLAESIGRRLPRLELGRPQALQQSLRGKGLSKHPD